MIRTSFIKNKRTRYFFIALFVTIGLSMSLTAVKDSQLGVGANTNKVIKLLIKIEKSFEKNTFQSILTFGVTYMLLNIKKNEKKGVIKSLLAVLFSLFTLFGYSYSKTNSWDLIFGGLFQFAKAVIIGTSYTIIFKLIIDYIFDFIIPKIKYKQSNNKIFNFIFEKHAFLMPLIIILICWIPYIILFYPSCKEYYLPLGKKHSPLQA